MKLIYQALLYHACRSLGGTVDAIAADTGYSRYAVVQYSTMLIKRGMLVKSASGRYWASSETVTYYKHGADLRRRNRIAIDKISASMDLSIRRRHIWLFAQLWGKDREHSSLCHRICYGGAHARKRDVADILSPPWEHWRLRSNVEKMEELCRLPASLLRDLADGPTDFVATRITHLERGDPISPVVHAAWRELRG